ncbi:hypothetical protein F9L16_23385 [Agarivorans sp. B2Z047]|uniref:terminase small subunit n=1 Tax=Agarivorans sp. B2Z047 TaxID=2652721 RepID=UPI00128D1F72|nr:terminase small subunit [Agarivorans sp. B2Z047]MPW31902.1 hypothetical protein [Agarivorans sp. B2Z047]UQN44876.1 terminase small subunit [Agarivorans sp. B2Z047]
MTKEKQIKLTPELLELASALTPLQRKFVILLVSSNMNQREAYVEAGGKAKTEKAQVASASRMLAQVSVKAFYDFLMNAAASDAIMSKQEAMERLTKSARATIHDICAFELKQVGEDKNGNPVMQTVWTMKQTEEIEPAIAAAIKSLTFTKTGPKIEMYDSNGSIKILSDLQGWNAPQKRDHTSSDGSMSPKPTKELSPKGLQALANAIKSDED